MSSLADIIRQHERVIVEEAMRSCGYHREEAARRLGVSRSTLYRILRRTGLREVAMPQCKRGPKVGHGKR
jgi:DNA-binding NtrC family response regulator